MAKKVYGFDEEGFGRVRKATRKILGMPRKGSQQRRQPAIVGGGCDARNEVWMIIVQGSPTGGTFDLDVKVNGSTETLTFDWDATAAEVQTEFETHTEIASGDVEASGGDFPDAVVNVEFKGDLENSSFDAPGVDFGSLSGGSGVAVIPARWRPGYPGDGSSA